MFKFVNNIEEILIALDECRVALMDMKEQMKRIERIEQMVRFQNRDLNEIKRLIEDKEDLFSQMIDHYLKKETACAPCEGSSSDASSEPS